MRITTLILAATAALSLAACAPGGYNDGYNRGGIQNSAAARTVGGAVAGAVIADATGGGRTKGALIGAVVGGGSCAVPGANNCY